MPFWIVLLSSLFSATLILGGTLYFSYVPMFFGVLSGDSYNAREKLILALIWAFPLTAIISLYVAWTSNSLFALIPFVHFAAVYAIRANKNLSAGASSEYASKQDNLEKMLSEVEYFWNDWSGLNSSHQFFVLFKLYASAEDKAHQVSTSITNSENLYRAIELPPAYKNASIVFAAKVRLDSLDRQTIETMVERIVNLAWENNCELISLDLLEASE